MRYVKAHAADLGIETSKIFVMGDSAGGTMALSLATGLRGGDDGSPAPAAERPAAVITGWGCCTLGSKTFIPARCEDGSWGETPGEVDNIFVPKRRQARTAAETQRVLQQVFAGIFLVFGRRARGWLPASVASSWPSDDAMSISPLSLAKEPGLPLTLMLIGGNDEIVPASQQLMFAETARAAGNRVGSLLFEDAVHGVGCHNSSAGRAAVQRFLKAQNIPLANIAGANDPEEHMRRSVRSFGLDKQPTWREYDVEALDNLGTEWLSGGHATLLARHSLAS